MTPDPKPQPRKKKIRKYDATLLKQDKECYRLFVIEHVNNGNALCCEECGEPIPEPSTLNIHHVLPKRIYKWLRHAFGNLCLLCWGCHDRLERGLVTDWMKNRIQLTKEKFNL
jgi:5-methylcytosine-specific restriction endonuclease McrA